MPLAAFSLLFFLSMLQSKAASASDPIIGSIGAIVDYSSRAGKEEKIAMEMAVEDFNSSTKLRLSLYVKDSQQDPVRAASLAMGLINNQEVQAILGMQTWQEAAFVAELGHKARIPVLSFAVATPPSASDRWPFLIRVTRRRCTQMRAIAAIVGSWKWRRVTVIHEDIDYVASGIIPCLAEALQEVGSEIDYQLAFPPMASSLSDKLKELKSRQCRVFIVHTSLESATRLFAEAKRMGIITTDSVWITTDGITRGLDFVNASVISSMQGVLGVKGYFLRTSERFADFQLRFRQRFRLEHPEEENPEPGIFALRAYDAVWAVAHAMERIGAKHNHPTSYFPKEIENSLDPEMNIKVSMTGQKLLEMILLSDFDGLRGEFRFLNRQLVPAKVFQVVNVVGKSYRELGFWSNGSDFSDGAKNSTSMKILGQIYWPGGPWTVPRGWTPLTSASPLRIGVPANSAFREFVNVDLDENGKFRNVKGFSIDVFKAAVKRLPYDLPYNFFPYNGTYDSLVESVHHKTFDAVVGDTSIIANRCRYAEFSQPYAESGLVVVVPVKSKQHNQAWIFMKPFSKTMWALTALINVYNGFIVWLIEPRLKQQFPGSRWNKLGTILWFSFTTLFSLHREKLYSNLSRMTMVAWLFVALILTQSYTANLSSMLTLQGLDTGLVDIESLKRSNAAVGCDSGSFVVKYLEEVIGFHPKNIKQYASGDDYPKALRSEEIKAAFLRVPYSKVLIAKYCNSFRTAGQINDVGGFGFVFPKGSPLIPDISQAILEVFESGKIQDMETALISSYNCSSSASDDNEPNSLRFKSFLGLFAITGGTSTFALILYGIRALRNNWQCVVTSLVISVQGSANELGSALTKHLKDAKYFFFKKRMETDSIGEKLAHNTEMTHSCTHGTGNLGNGLDLEESTEFHIENHTQVFSENSSTSHQHGK